MKRDELDCEAVRMKVDWLGASYDATAEAKTLLHNAKCLD